MRRVPKGRPRPLSARSRWQAGRLNHRNSHRCTGHTAISGEKLLPSVLHLYLDGSGHVEYPPPIGDGDTDYYVLAGVLVTEDQRDELEYRIDDLVKQRFPDRDPRTVDIHLSPLCAGQEEWATLSGPERGRFVDDLRDVVLDVGPILFAQVNHKPRYWDHFVKIEPEPPPEHTLRYVLGRVDKTVRNHGDNSTITMDRHSNELVTRYNNLVDDIRRNGDKITGRLTYRPTDQTKLNSFYDPQYLATNASRCLQVADYVAHFTWRAAERAQADRIRELDSLWDRYYSGREREPFFGFVPDTVEERFFG